MAAGDEGARERIRRSVAREESRRYLADRLSAVVSPVVHETRIAPDVADRLAALEQAGRDLLGDSWHELADTEEERRALAAEVARQRALWTPRLQHRRHHFSVDGVPLDVADVRRWSSERVPLEPAELGRRMRSCAAGWSLLVSRDGPRINPLGCNLRAYCPVCQSRAGGVRVVELLPVLSTLVERGHRVVHVTATQRADLHKPKRPHPVVVSRRERGIVADRHATRRGRAVPGESLRSSLDRLGGAWRKVTNGYGENRAWWAATVSAVVYGVEWTGRASVHAPGRGHRCFSHGPTGWTRSECYAAHHAAPYHLRWHAHRHALVVLRPGVDPEKWAADWSARWCAASGADPLGQHVRELDASNLESAIVETLKYPFKPSEMTSAQCAEVIAAARSEHVHQLAGHLHGRSEVARAAYELEPGAFRFGLLDRLDERDRALAEDLAEGYARREAARTERACVHLYREARAYDGRRKDVGHGLSREWTPGGRDLRPVTVGWIAERLKSAGDTASETVWCWHADRREWRELVDLPVSSLLAAATEATTAPSEVA